MGNAVTAGFLHDKYLRQPAQTRSCTPKDGSLDLPDLVQRAQTANGLHEQTRTGPGHAGV